MAIEVLKEGKVLINGTKYKAGSFAGMTKKEIKVYAGDNTNDLYNYLNGKVEQEPEAEPLQEVVEPVAEIVTPDVEATGTGVNAEDIDAAFTETGKGKKK